MAEKDIWHGGEGKAIRQGKRIVIREKEMIPSDGKS